MKFLYKTIFISISVIFFTASCQSSPKIDNKQAANNQPANVKTAPVNPANSMINTDTTVVDKPDEQENFSKLFKGTIGDDDNEGKSKIPPFQMRLKRNGNNLSGVYRYRNSTKDIALQGKIDDDSKFTLTESIGGKETGKFEGSFENGDEGFLKMSGTWAKPGSNDDLGFSAEEIPMEMSGDIYVDDKSITEKNNRFDISINYPQINGAKSPNAAKLNQALTNLAAQYQRDFKSLKDGEKISAEVSYTIHLANDNLFSIEFTDEVDSGGAHPSHNTKTLNFDMKAGKPLQLADLFKPDSKYLEKISAICLAKIKEDLKDGIFEDGIKPLAKNYQTWVIQKDGLMIYFDEYQAAPYVSGRQEVSIDYQDLKDLIKSDGVLASSAK